MFRDLVSNLVLIFVPVISLTIAIVPFVWVRKKTKPTLTSVIASRAERGVAISDTRNPQGKIASLNARNDNSGETGTYPNPSATKPHITSKLWIAFFAGLIGNVVWWSIVEKSTNDAITIYLNGLNTSGVLFSFFLYSFFIVTTPFIFYKIKHGHFSGKAIIYNLIVSLLTAGIVLGVWIVLAVVAYRGLFYQLN